jgi:predicted Fe-S protein YdhL (DUF1289 family)
VKDDDPVWSRDEVQSPCVKLCIIDPKVRLCIGCHRTISEITDWSQMDHAARAAIMADLPNRIVPAPIRRGGRQGRLSS